jgi:hypothetical protein
MASGKIRADILPAAMCPVDPAMRPRRYTRCFFQHAQNRTRASELHLGLYYWALKVSQRMDFVAHAEPGVHSGREFVKCFSTLGLSFLQL